MKDTLVPLNSSSLPLVFSCSYKSRVFCEPLDVFVDALDIEADVEADAVNALKAVHKRLRKDMTNVFPAILKRSEGLTLFLRDLTVTSGLAFGKYWVYLSGASIVDENEKPFVVWHLKVLRPLLRYDNEALMSVDHRHNDSDLLNMSDVMDRMRRGFSQQSVMGFCKGFGQVLNAENLTNVLRFLAILVMAVCSGLVELLPKLLQLLNRTIFEISNLVRQLTPFLLGCLDCFTKMVGGLYLLINMVYRDLRHGRARPHVRPQQDALRRDVQRPYWQHQQRYLTKR